MTERVRYIFGTTPCEIVVRAQPDGDVITYSATAVIDPDGAQASVRNDRGEPLEVSAASLDAALSRIVKTLTQQLGPFQRV